MAGTLLLLAAGWLYSWLGPQKQYSENENRYLNQFPTVSWETIKEGKLQNQLDLASKDQIPFRDRWMELSTVLTKCTGSSCINGVYLGKDGYYFNQVLDSDLSQKRYRMNLEIVKKMAEERTAPVSVLLVPSPETILTEKLPNDAAVYDAVLLNKEGKNCLGEHWLSVEKALKHASADTQVYFRTDHHWTLAGAYEAYKVYEKQMGHKVKSYGWFEPELASDTFYGTLYSKVLDPAAKPDELYLPSNLPQGLCITADGEEKDGIYETSMLAKKDKYAVYFGGNYGKVVIEQPNKKTQDTLIVFKDSFANSMVPFLTHAYQKIIMIDLRYYHQSVQKLLEQEEDAQVLVLYELSNFARSETINGMLK